MLNRLPEFLLQRLPLHPELRRAWIDRLIPMSFGQLGEDAVIDNHLCWLGLAPHKAGFYLDIGAHHPTSGSNTWRFYRRGAQGIAIDIGKRKQRLWRQVRPRDTFFNAAVVPDSWPESSVTFLLSGDYGSATDSVVGFGFLLNQADVHTVSAPALKAGDLVNQVLSLDAWWSAPWRVLNIDIEGLDEQVLHDLQLPSLKPDVVAVECFLPADVSCWEKISWIVQDSSLVASMSHWGYSLQSICGPTLVFVRISSKLNA